MTMSSATTSPKADVATTSPPAMSNQDSTPGSSPPPSVADNDDNDDNGVSKSIQDEETRLRSAREKKDEQERSKGNKASNGALTEEDEGQTDKKFKALEYLLSQSKLYSAIMLERMQKQEEEVERKDQRSRRKAERREENAEKEAEKGMRRATTRGKGAVKDEEEEEKGEAVRELPTRGKARGKAKADGDAKSKAGGKKGDISSYFKKEQLEAKAGKGGKVTDALEEAVAGDAADEKEDAEDDGDGVKADERGFDNLRSARQPELVSGGTMRAYQLEGLEWLTSLYENGLNGILADEMGLGKTIQTIAFLAFLRERGVYGPFLVAAPLSTTTNWVQEFQKWTPDVPVTLYHGSKQEREQIRRKELKRPGSETFPIVITSYEICMNDRKFLAGFGWKYIIIDEGHRIKNLDCRLIRELQSYQSANRLLITGTPLQNNLKELWALLHFLMPDIFHSLQEFESWFDFSNVVADRAGYETLLNEEKQQKLVASLHAILKPFLLRRVKRDVEKLLPKKREYVLFAPLTSLQRELYEAILDGTSREYLEKRATDVFLGRGDPTQPLATYEEQEEDEEKKPAPTTGKRKSPLDSVETQTPSKSAKSSRASTPASGATLSSRRAARGGSSKKKRNYEEISDAAFFRNVESGKATPDTARSSVGSGDGEDEEEDSSATAEAKIEAKARQMAKKLIANKKLQNPVMQLRLCCDSPFNFYDPFQTPLTSSSSTIGADTKLNDALNEMYEPSQMIEPDESLVTTSGKMMLLDALLPPLFADGHKVLIFSQFKSQLDLIEQYATSLRGWPVCRIDGSIPQAERQAQIAAFNRPSSTAPSGSGKNKRRSRKTAEEEEEEETPNLFLLSTRAGGQGINLAAADTVFLFDSDWNPQQDAQAQDRAHRIGQTRNVIVYRLATRGTVEEVLLRKAEGKRRLEKLVIRKGGHVRGGDTKPSSKSSKKQDDDEEEGEEEEEEKKKGGESTLDRLSSASAGTTSAKKRSAKREDGDAGLADELGELRRLLLERDEGTTLDVAGGDSPSKKKKNGTGARSAARGASTSRKKEKEKAEKREVLSQRDIAILTDRSDGAYEKDGASEAKLGAKAVAETDGGEGEGEGEGAFRALETSGENGLLEGLSR